MPGALDTLTRIVMLVLAGMVTMSLIGAIAAMSNQAVPGIALERQREPAASPPRTQPREQPRPTSQPGAAPVQGSPGGIAIAAPPAPEADPIERWLEAIAYALMAIAGLLALIALILWRSLSELRRR